MSESAGSVSGRAAKKILVVDDEPHILRALTINLNARHYDVAASNSTDLSGGRRPASFVGFAASSAHRGPRMRSDVGVCRTKPAPLTQPSGQNSPARYEHPLQALGASHVSGRRYRRRKIPLERAANELDARSHCWTSCEREFRPSNPAMCPHGEP